MKRVLLIIYVIICSASLVLAQSQGAVGVYADQAGSNCNIVEAPSMFIYYYQLASPGATGIEFSTDVSQTVGWTYAGTALADSENFLAIGDFFSGISVGYGSCLIGNIYIGFAIVATTSSSPNCTRIYVTGHPVPNIPGETHPIFTDCGPQGGTTFPIEGSFAVVNDDGSCTCTGSIPAQNTSWGMIKSLYQ